MKIELEDQVQQSLRERFLESDNGASSSTSSVASDSEESELDSCQSLYQLTVQKCSFVCLNIMILMEYSEGGLTLRNVIDNRPDYLTREIIFNLFS